MCPNCDFIGYMCDSIVNYWAGRSFGIIRAGSLQNRDCFIRRRTARNPGAAFNTNRGAENE